MAPQMKRLHGHKKITAIILINYNSKISAEKIGFIFKRYNEWLKR